MCVVLSLQRYGFSLDIGFSFGYFLEYCYLEKEQCEHFKKKKSAQEWKPLKRPLVAGPGHDPGTS